MGVGRGSVVVGLGRGSVVVGVGRGSVVAGAGTVTGVADPLVPDVAVRALGAPGAGVTSTLIGALGTDAASLVSPP